ncbi:UNVERIFIED_CONTAM: hypothetical protein NY603_19115, partial [Bacteroidetes bacterium 56_B9]
MLEVVLLQSVPAQQFVPSPVACFAEFWETPAWASLIAVRSFVFVGLHERICDFFAAVHGADENEKR